VSDEKTPPRGFKIYSEFEDMAGHNIRVQESSNVYGGIWIFNDGKVSTNLSVENARALIRSLENAIEHQQESKRIWRRPAET